MKGPLCSLVERDSLHADDNIPLAWQTYPPIFGLKDPKQIQCFGRSDQAHRVRHFQILRNQETLLMTVFLKRKHVLPLLSIPNKSNDSSLEIRSESRVASALCDGSSLYLEPDSPRIVDCIPQAFQTSPPTFPRMQSSFHQLPRQSQSIQA